MLISAAQLRDLTGNGEPVLVDCRYRLEEPGAGYEAYVDSHVPGAAYVHLHRDLSGEGTPGQGRHPLPDPEKFARTLGRLGVARHRDIVAYDDCGGQIAARFWWLCRWAGLNRVMLLDGGWPAWLAEGGEVTHERPVERQSVFEFAPIAGKTVASALLKQLLNAGECLLLDARAAPRYRGEQELLDPIAGHIPGAVNYPCGQNLTGEGRFRAADQLRDQFKRVITGWRADQVIHSCGSGVTACHNLFAMELAGLAGSRLFAPSWSGWVAEPGNVYLQGAYGEEGGPLIVPATPT